MAWQAPGGALRGPDGGAVSEAPDEPLSPGRHELAVDPGKPGHGIDHQRRAVERRAEPLDHDHDHEDRVSGGRADEGFHVGAIQLDGRIEVALVQVPARPGPAPDNGTEGGALRVAADESLRKYDQSGAIGRALG